jgi:signal transduction histidine kinase
MSLACVAAVIVLVPGLPVAWRAPRLAVIITTLTTSVALVLFLLGVSQFAALGRLDDLLVGAAFGELGLTSLNSLVGLVFGFGTFGLPGSDWAILIGRGLAAALLAACVVGARLAVPASVRRPALGVGLAVLGVLTVVSYGVTLASSPSLPWLLDAGAVQEIRSHSAIDDVLAGQAPTLVLGDAATTVLLAICGLSQAVLPGRVTDAKQHCLALALPFLVFGQALTEFFPSVAVDYASTGDLFRLVGILILLFGLGSRFVEEAAERATREERLRLSRDLHDGLAQRLSLLHLQLGDMQHDASSSPGQALRLGALTRQVESAVLEARQTIGALREGTLDWDDFTGGLARFVEEFAGNHNLEARVEFAGVPIRIDAAVQMEILRIVHEALSNSIRHGQARSVLVTCTSTPGGWLDLEVRDDGRGVLAKHGAPAAGGGIGLVSLRERVGSRGGSMRVEFGSGNGLVQVRLPVHQ